MNKTLKVVSYNCFEGAEHTRSALLDVISQASPDVLQLQEVNGWGEGSPSELDKVATGFDYQTVIYGDSNTRFKLSTIANRAIISSEVITKDFWHSAIHTVLPFNGGVLHLWNVHLDPRSEDGRLLEVEHLIESVGTEQYALITGDLNSLAALDNYSPGLVEKFARQGLRKFGDTALRYDVTNRLLGAGFVDIGALYPWENTVPTPANKDAAHAAKLRLDYGFASPSLAKLVSSYQVIKTDASNKASDHYPVELVFKESAS